MSEISGKTRKWIQNWHYSDLKSPVLNLDERLRKIEERFLIIDEPSSETLEKYEILKNAYREYKLIEKLILGKSIEGK